MTYTRAYLTAKVDTSELPSVRLITDDPPKGSGADPLVEVLLTQGAFFATFATRDAAWCRGAAAAFTQAADLLDK
jgi:hypothetical protein